MRRLTAGAGHFDVCNLRLARAPAALRGLEEVDTGFRVPGSGNAEPGVDLFKASEGRWGSREAEITNVEMTGASGQPAHLFQSGERVEIRLHVRANQPVRDFAFGVGIFNADGICCCGTNTAIDGGAPSELRGEGLVTFTVDALDLVEGTYKLDVA